MKTPYDRIVNAMARTFVEDGTSEDLQRETAMLMMAVRVDLAIIVFMQHFVDDEKHLVELVLEDVRMHPMMQREVH